MQILCLYYNVVPYGSFLVEANISQKGLIHYGNRNLSDLYSKYYGYIICIKQKAVTA
jgi:hypothetical protein